MEKTIQKTEPVNCLLKTEDTQVRILAKVFPLKQESGGYGRTN